MYVRHPAKFRLFLTHDLVRAVLILTRYGIRLANAQAAKYQYWTPARSCDAILCDMCSIPRSDRRRMKTFRDTRGIDKNWSMKAAFRFPVQGWTEFSFPSFSRILATMPRENGRYFSACPQIEIMPLAAFYMKSIFRQVCHSSFEK